MLRIGFDSGTQLCMTNYYSRGFWHLKALWKRLPELRRMKHLKRDELLMKLGAARQQWPTAWRLVAIRMPK